MKNLLKELGLTEENVKKILLGKKKPKPKVLTRYFTDEEFAFGIVSDTHLCSTHEKLDELHTFYSICKKSGVKFILHAGDIVAGWGMYKGQENEVKVFGAMAQAEYAIKNYPREEGISTYFITGNHCNSFYKTAGVDVGEIISQREDMVYLGQCGGEVIINGVKFQLLHPDGGGAYALSYRGQKIAEQIASGKKPHVLILGHFHVANFFFYRNIHIFNAGAFEGQNLYLLRKGLNPAIGGWICKVKAGKKDPVIALQATWIPFFGKAKNGQSH